MAGGAEAAAAAAAGAGADAGGDREPLLPKLAVGADSAAGGAASGLAGGGGGSAPGENGHAPDGELPQDGTPAACPTGTCEKRFWSCPGNAGFKVRRKPCMRAGTAPRIRHGADFPVFFITCWRIGSRLLCCKAAKEDMLVDRLQTMMQQGTKGGHAGA